LVSQVQVRVDLHLSDELAICGQLVIHIVILFICGQIIILEIVMKCYIPPPGVPTLCTIYYRYMEHLRREGDGDLLTDQLQHCEGNGGEEGLTQHLKHPAGDNYTLYLARQLHSVHTTGLYNDSVLHCQDGNISVNRLIIGLLYSNLATDEIFCLPNKLDLILTGVKIDEVGQELLEILGVDTFNNDENEDNAVEENLDERCEEGFVPGSMVKTELECSPDINVKLEVKNEEEGGLAGGSQSTARFKEKWTCYICKETFRFAEHLTSHALELHNTDRPFQCSYCQFTTKERGQLLRHENIHTRAHQYSCDVCGKSFLDTRDLNNHKTVHTNERNMPCQMCEKSFKSDLYLHRHIKLVHSDSAGEFKCEVCDKVFKTKDYLRRHTKKIHCADPIYFVCSFCGKNFKSASHRKDHEEIHRGEADAECDICGAQVRKRNLERHMKTHSEESEFQCDICAKPLKTAEAFKAHMNSHELPYKCEFCEKAFSTKYSMKSHTVQQHLLKKEADPSKVKVEKPMTKCDQCDYQCATARYMKTHKAVKHDGVLHNCQDCSFTTGDLGSLRSHRRAKHEGVVYSCDICDFKSGYKNNLKNHKAVAHFTVDGRNVPCTPQFSLSKPLPGAAMGHREQTEEKLQFPHPLPGPSADIAREHAIAHSEDKPQFPQHMQF